LQGRGALATIWRSKTALGKRAQQLGGPDDAGRGTASSAVILIEGRAALAEERARPWWRRLVGLSQDGRRRRSPLAAAASHERRRGAQELLGSPRWPPWMGTAAAGRRTDGGRWPETIRGVIRHSPQLGGCHLLNKPRRTFVLVGHSIAFPRQVAFAEAAGGRTARVCINSSTRKLVAFVTLKRLRRLVADSASFPAHHSWGLVFACQSVARSHPAFAKGPWM
jgi:hypothetical protein